MDARAVLVVVALLASSTAASAQTNALGVSPSSIEVVDAVPGGSYEAVVTVQNGFDEPAHVTIEPDGDVGDWTVTEPAVELDVPARGRATVNVLIEVPEDVGLGAHTGILRIVAEAGSLPESGGSGAGLRYAVGIAMNVTVTGVEREAVEWSGATVEKVEVGNPVIVFVHVENTGNVRASVAATAEAKDATGRSLASGSAEQDILPGHAQVLEVDLGPLPEGNHEIAVAAEGPGGPYTTTTVVQVVPAGALARTGRIAGLDVAAEVDVDAPLRIEARFENTGSASIARAKLVFEVFRDGRLAGQGSGEPLLVATGATAPLVAYYTPTQPGEHRVAVKVSYDGLETAPTEKTFDVLGGTAPTLDKPAPGAGWPAVALGLAALALLRRR